MNPHDNSTLIAELCEAAEDFLRVWADADNPDAEARAAIALSHALAKARGENADA
jgi:hypothetical protein